MMKELKRRYVYEENYNEIMEWARSNEIRPPNNKDNFPYFLSEYLKELKGITPHLKYMFKPTGEMNKFRGQR